MKFKKFIFYFLLLSLSGSLLFAQTEDSSNRPRSRSLNDLVIPLSLGKIQERFVGSNPRFVIYIQDVHAHFTAQENIAAIIDYLNSNYGINTVGVEGNWSSTSYPKTWALPSSREKQMLTRALLEEDYITGPAYAAMFSQTPIMLVGIEDPAIYQANREIYLKYLQSRKETNSKITFYGEEISQLKQSTYNPDLLSFDTTVVAFREGKNIDKFLPSLLTWADKKGVDLSDLKDIQTFKEASQLEKNLHANKDKLEGETKRLMDTLKLKNRNLEQMLRQGKIPQDKLQFYPYVKMYNDLLELQGEIEYREFFDQIDTAIARIKEKLFVSDKEKALDQKANRYLFIKRIISMEATPDDLKAYESGKDLMDTDVQAAGLEEELQLALNFYKLAQDRDKIFADKIINDSHLSGNIAIVTGGFHTEGLSERLKQDDISYIIIAPELNSEPANQDLYFQRLQQNILQQTLSERNNRENDGQDEAIAGATEGLQSKDINGLPLAIEAVNQFQTQNGSATFSSDQRSEKISFEDLTPEEQNAAIQTVYDQITEGKKSVWLVIRASVLKQMLAHKDTGEMTRKVLNHILTNESKNKIALLYQSYTDIPEEMAGEQNVLLVPNIDIDRALKNQRKLRDALNKRVVAVIASDYKNPSLVVLDESVVSLLLYRALIEGDWKYTFNDPRTQSLIQDILQSILTEQTTQTAA